LNEETTSVFHLTSHCMLEHWFHFIHSTAITSCLLVHAWQLQWPNCATLRSKDSPVTSRVRLD
jgi:hypothetical protein